MASNNQRTGVSHFTRRPLELEELETRTVPAGDVTAAVVGGSLIITGDDLSNSIIIDHAGLGAGELRISSGADATTINGGAAPFIAEHVTKDVRILVKDGNDTVAITDVTLPRNLAVNGGSGDNELTITPASAVGGSLAVRNGAGVQKIGIAGTIGRNVSISDGVGGSAIGVAGDIGGNLTVKNADGNDALLGETLTVGGSVRISSGLGESAVGLETAHIKGSLIATGKAGNASLALLGVVVDGGLSIGNGNGDSSTSIRESAVAGAVAIINGKGQDECSVFSSHFGKFSAGNGPGGSHTLFDRVLVDKSARVASGDGYDDFVINNSTIAKSVTLNQGAGDSDTIIISVSVGVNDDNPALRKGVNIIGGDGKDGVLCLRLHTGRDIVMKGGGGHNILQLEYAEVGRDVIFTGGRETDTVYTDRCYFGRNVTVAAGKGDDIIVFDDRDVAQPPVTAGRLSAAASQEPELAGSVFNGFVKVNAGAGNDTFVLGSPTGTGYPLVFRGPLLLNGGSGEDAIDMDGHDLYYGKSHNILNVENPT